MIEAGQVWKLVVYQHKPTKDFVYFRIDAVRGNWIDYTVLAESEIFPGSGSFDESKDQIIKSCQLTTREEAELVKVLFCL